MATPSFQPFPTRSPPPFTSPPVCVSFFATYSLGAWGLCCSVSSSSAVLSHTWSCLVVHACSPAKAPLGLSYGALLRLDHPTGKTILKGFQGGNTKEGQLGPVWHRWQRHRGCSALDVCLSAGALPRQLPHCARRAFATFVCDLCVATAAYGRHQDSPLSRDSTPRQPCRQLPCPMTDLSCTLSSCPVP